MHTIKILLESQRHKEPLKLQTGLKTDNIYLLGSMVAE